MKEVTQLTPFTCGLACIESVCFDFGINKKQEDFLRDFKGELLSGITEVGHFGCTNPRMIEYILRRIGLSVQSWKDHRPEIQSEIFERIDPIQNPVIISAHFELNYHHVVRFNGINSDGKILVMNPTFSGATIDKYQLSDLIKWDYEFLLITRC